LLKIKKLDSSNRVLEKLRGFTYARHSPRFAEPEGLLPCSQERNTCIYLETDQ